jgi:hypothetical protein
MISAPRGQLPWTNPAVIARYDREIAGFGATLKRATQCVDQSMDGREGGAVLSLGGRRGKAGEARDRAIAEAALGDASVWIQGDRFAIAHPRLINPS